MKFKTSCKCQKGCVECHLTIDNEEECLSCMEGYNLKNGKCSICPAGYYSEGLFYPHVMLCKLLSESY